MRETERETAPARATSAPSLDAVFDVLSDRRRRYALYYLHGLTDGVATVDEIADHVLSREGTKVDRSRIVTSLQHVHLPRLDDVGVLEHDARSETVRYWGQPSLEEWLEHAKHKERP